MVTYFARFWPEACRGVGRGRYKESLQAGEAQPQVLIRATGGGSYKHAELFKKAGLVLEVSEEMPSIVLGLNFLMSCVPGEVFSVALRDSSPLASPRGETERALYCPVAAPPRDFLYVSIGSGVSIVEVRDRGGAGGTRYRRVGGSSLGGSSFWGLVRLLTSCSTFDEVIRLTERGASSKVDMLVSDIYGDDGARDIGLGGDVIAASFGKIAMGREEDKARGPMFLMRYVTALLRHYEEGFWLVVLSILSLPGVNQVCEALGIMRFAEARAASTSMCGPYHAHDVALSLLRMVSNNIGQIACLSAQQSQMRHIVFGGSFIRDHPYTISTISSAVRFFSRGSVQPLFLRHDGFVGAIGAHLSGNPLAGSAFFDKMDPAAGVHVGRSCWRPEAAAPQAAAPQAAAPLASPPAPLHPAARPAGPAGPAPEPYPQPFS